MVVERREIDGEGRKVVRIKAWVGEVAVVELYVCVVGGRDGLAIVGDEKTQRYADKLFLGVGEKER